MKHYKVIGIMSGTSMDGVDLAYVEFTEDNGKWSYILKHADTVEYEEMWRVRLSKLNRQEGTKRMSSRRKIKTFVTRTSLGWNENRLPLINKFVWEEG